MCEGMVVLESRARKSDINEYYGNPTMAMQMRMFYERIYRRGPMRQDIKQMRQHMMMVESSGVVNATMSMASMFGVS